MKISIHIQYNILYSMCLYINTYRTSIIPNIHITFQAREVDMRASPYDLKSYLHPSGNPLVGLGGGFNPNPIYIETSEVLYKCLYIHMICTCRYLYIRIDLT